MELPNLKGGESRGPEWRCWHLASRKRPQAATKALSPSMKGELAGSGALPNCNSGVGLPDHESGPEQEETNASK